MIFYGLKATTKDIDVALLEPQQVDILVTALRSLSYCTPDSDMITAPYKEMAAQQIMENEDGFRWDIFMRTVSNALTVSDGMLARATSLYHTGDLAVRIASKQDLFLLKSVTERETDLDDMRFLAESGLDWTIVENECQHQSAQSGRLWENALYSRLLDLKDLYGIQSPIERSLRHTIEEKLMFLSLKQEIARGNNTIKRISEALNESQNSIRKAVRLYEEKGLLLVDRTRRRYTITIAQRLRPQEDQSP